MNFYVGLGLLVFMASIVFALALFDSEPAPEWVEAEEYRRNHWYK